MLLSQPGITTIPSDQVPYFTPGGGKYMIKSHRLVMKCYLIVHGTILVPFYEPPPEEHPSMSHSVSFLLSAHCTGIDGKYRAPAAPL